MRTFLCRRMCANVIARKAGACATKGAYEGAAELGEAVGRRVGSCDGLQRAAGCNTVQRSSMMLDLSAGVDRLVIGDLVQGELVRKSGSVARLRVVAPREIGIKKEVMQATQSRGKHGLVERS